MSKVADRPRGFVPSGAPGRANVDMGSDTHGWYADAVKVANDRVNQIRSSQKAYERGMRPFELLNIGRNRGAIVPFGVNSVGGQFVSQPSYGGNLTGGIMFTKAGQDYVQDLLNKRQQQYAEMYGTTQQQQNAIMEAADDGDKVLSVVYPVLNTLLDDLRTFTIKSDSYSKFWAIMLTSLPLLGANSRDRILEIANDLETAYRTAAGIAEQRRRAKTLSPKEADQMKSMSVRIARALEVMREYAGARADGSSPIDSTSAEQRASIVDELNRRLGEKVSSGYQRRARITIFDALEGSPEAEMLDEVPNAAATAAARAAEAAAADAAAAVAAQPIAPPMLGMGRGRGGAQSRQVRLPSTATNLPAEDTRHNFQRKITQLAPHHRLLNARNERD